MNYQNRRMFVLTKVYFGFFFRCQPREHIVFRKTHKTASSTLACIFQRYGMSRNFSFVIPASGHWANFENLWIKPSNVYKYEKVMKYWGGFDMSVCHGRYKRNEVDMVVPNATYVTIIRNPVSHFVSAFVYYNYSKRVNLPYSENVLSRFFEIKDFQSKLRHTRGGQQVENGIAHDLIIDTTVNITEEIQRLHREFDLVILSEYFDESLILLKKLLCWDFNDLLYLSIRKHTKTYDHLYNVTNEVRDRILESNKIDAAIYTYFERVFWNKVKAYGPKFDEDLKELRLRLRKLQEECNVYALGRYRKQRFMRYKVFANDTEYCKKFFIIDDSNSKQSQKDLRDKLRIYEKTRNLEKPAPKLQTGSR